MNVMQSWPMAGACLLSGVAALAGDSGEHVEQLKERILTVMPNEWRIDVVDHPGQPYWTAASPSDMVEIRLIGPERAGYRYRLSSGESKAILFKNEIIYLWVMPAEFDDGWTLGKRLLNRTSKTPTELPSVLATTDEIRIYGMRGWRRLVDRDPQPPGTAEARTIYETRSRGSWSNWKKDLGEVLNRK